jgi:hypothetical protein
MNLKNCDGCNQPAFDLALTTYGLCQTCEARMTHRVVLYAIFPDEVCRIDVTDAATADLHALIFDVEDDNGTFIYRHEMILQTSNKPTGHGVPMELPERCDCGCHPSPRVNMEMDGYKPILCCDCPDVTQVILVAFEVHGDTMENAQVRLMQLMPPTAQPDGVECWWIAMDGRHDGSDCDSAVFVPMGEQSKWTTAVKAVTS